MKLLALILTIVTTAAAQQLDNENQSGDWLPTPDGYKWPKEAKKSPEFKSVLRDFGNLSQTLRKAIRECWPEDEDPDQVSIAEIDLNVDGKPELFVGIPIYSGTGGTYYEILSTTNDKAYKSIGVIQGWGFQFLMRKNGWLQIEGMSKGGGGNYTRYLMTFAGKGYKMSRNEGHDFNTRTVTVRNTKAKQSDTHQPNTRPESKSK